MTTDTTDEQTIDEHAAARIVPWQANPDFPVVTGRRHPRWQILLAAPPEAAALVKHVEADRRALTAQVEADYQTRVNAVQREYAAGDMTPRRRGEMLAEAAIERSTRLARIDDAFAGLDEQSAMTRARRAAADAQVAAWREAIDAWESAHSGPDAA